MRYIHISLTFQPLGLPGRCNSLKVTLFCTVSESSGAPVFLYIYHYSFPFIHYLPIIFPSLFFFPSIYFFTFYYFLRNGNVVVVQSYLCDATVTILQRADCQHIFGTFDIKKGQGKAKTEGLLFPEVKCYQDNVRTKKKKPYLIPPPALVDIEGSSSVQ